MRIALLLAFLAVSCLRLAAEDWTTTDGKTYHQVKVVSYDAAYVTILHADGGGRVLLSTLNADLQKRFNYDPAKAAAAIAATAAADQRDKDALAREKSQAAALNTQGQQQVSSAVAQASLPPPPVDTNEPAAVPPPGSGDVASDQQPIANAPTTAIDDYDYGASGYSPYGGYGGYYVYPGYGNGYGRGYSQGNNTGNHYGTRGFNHQIYTPSARPTTASATTAPTGAFTTGSNVNGAHTAASTTPVPGRR